MVQTDTDQELILMTIDSNTMHECLSYAGQCQLSHHIIISDYIVSVLS